jgi:hypothetical protein
MMVLCGYGHIILCIGSAFIPKALRWRDHLKNLQPLLRQMFWTYAAYILVINFCFGIVSILGSEELLNRSFLAKSITLFIGLYWLARIAIQFLYFDKSDAPTGLMYTSGEIMLVSLFAIFAATYLAAFSLNCSWI